MRKILIILTILLLVQFSFNLSAECIKGDCVNGQGTYNFASGDQYIGEWKDDKLHGQGTYTWKEEGDQYIGEFKDGKKHGQGTYNFGPNSKFAGDQYVGEWNDNKYHGQGTYTYSDGTSDRGIWRNDELISYLCKEMGLSPNTEAYGKCILKMMD